VHEAQGGWKVVVTKVRHISLEFFRKGGG